jgi:tRNA threonylcarbamoyladenosine biosynthesis protein TsaB
MIILGIETATEICGIALTNNGTHLDECLREEKHIHAEQLLPMVEHLLKKNCTELASLDGIAVSIGPGSFTGLRIGLSVAKGLAESVNLPLVAVPTLTSVAFALNNTLMAREQTIVSVSELQRDEFAVAIFASHEFSENNFAAINVLPIKAFPEKAKKYFEQFSERTLLCGPGSEKIFRWILENLSRQHNVTLAETEFRKCNPRFVSAYGEMMLHKNAIADIPSLQPFYGKDFVAKQSTIFARITREQQ